jgi:hypothetical protein
MRWHVFLKCYPSIRQNGVTAQEITILKVGAVIVLSKPYAWEELQYVWKPWQQ